MKKGLYIGGGMIAVVLGVLVALGVFKSPQNITSVDPIAGVRAFMGQDSLELISRSTQHPSNFTVGKSSQLPGKGVGSITTPQEWEREVFVFDQKNLTENCVQYSYEVDVRIGKVVQVQLAGNPPVGSDLENEQTKCFNSLQQTTISDAEAKEIALAYARKDNSINDAFTFTQEKQGGRYDFKWEDRSYKLPEEMVSEPYKYPVVRVVIDNKGNLVTYLNTVILYK